MIKKLKSSITLAMKVSVYTNKVILEHSHIRFAYILSMCFCITMTDMSSCSRPYNLQRLVYLLSGHFIHKSANFWLKHSSKGNL